MQHNYQHLYPLFSIRLIMKALVYHGPNNVQVDDKPRPTIQSPEDVILRVTSTALCGSNLHLFMVLYREWNQDRPWDTNLWELWKKLDLQ
jgi:hypothetical protein